MKRNLLFTLAVLVLFMFAPASCSSDSAEIRATQYKAAIVDQLHLLEPNQTLIEKTVGMLESYGFKVDVWQGKEITVDFFQDLPKYGYKVIVFRVHSGLLLALMQSQIVPSETTYLLTGETYTTAKYVSEQLNERVSNAMMSEEYPLVFAVNSEFIRNESEGSFDNTVIVMMGCESLYLDDIADAFIQKGASAYLGFSGIVSLNYADNATLKLTSNLLTDNVTLEQGVAGAMAELGYDPYYGGYLKYYPTESGSRTIKELIE